MKLLYIVGICLILCIQISYQLPFGGGSKDRRLPVKDRKPLFQDKVIKPILEQQDDKRFGKSWKNHEIRAVGEAGPQIDEDAGQPLIGVPSDFEIGTGINSDSINTGTKIANEKDIQKVKRGWFKKLWNTIKGVVVGALFGMIKRSANDQPPIESIDELDSEDFDNLVLSDDIIEVDLGTSTPENKAELEKEIQIVKRGWFKKIRRKIKNVLTGAVVGTVVGSVVKRNNNNNKDEDEEGIKGGNLPLLLKTLRLRPGTADEITEIVEKLGNSSEFQDAMVNEILNDKDDESKDDEIVLQRSGKMIIGLPKCKFVGWRLKCSYK